MGKLDVKLNKSLVLKQVLIKELRNIKVEDLDSEIRNFQMKINLLKVQVFGPLITKSYGTTIHDDGTVTTDYDLMVQAHDYKNYKNHFKIAEKVECVNCAYIRFQGTSEEIHYAYSKLELFFYENDLMSNGSIFNVFVSNHKDHMVLDVFKPVVML